MYVRILGQREILNALHLAWNVFEQDVLPQCKNEEIEAFQQFIKMENIMSKVQTEEIKVFGAWNGNELCGMSVLRENGHIQILFVKKEKQKQGYGKLLVQQMGQYLLKTKGITEITAHVMPSAVEIYEKWGMYAVAPEQSDEGRAFVPLSMTIPSEIKYKNPKNNRKWYMGFLVAGIVIIMIITGLIGFIVYKLTTMDWNRTVQNFEEFYSDGYVQDDIFNEPAEEELSGIEAIPEYIEKRTDFELGEGSYVLNQNDAGTSRTAIEFEIYYPQITGLEASLEEKVNQELEKCAMETAERIYLNPTDDIKEKVLGEQYPALMSFVEYKVTYLSDEFISVVFQDYYYEGSENAYYLELRTRNISLVDGTVYEVEDIVELNDRFITEWADIMRDEADNLDLIQELSKSDMKNTLSGEEMNGVYKDNFFLDEEGIEIGLSFKYPEGDENNTGYFWVTAPFDWDEIKEFKTESKFWDLVK